MNSYPQPVVSSHVYCYNPFSNLWLRSAPLRFGRSFSTLINYEDSLHIIGGAVVKNDELISTDSIDVWDDRQGKWKLKANMAVPRHGHVVALLGSQMLMIGGSTTKYVKYS
uniref:Kelch-like protein 40b isoform x4 n=1 Tax=Triatoma infestans TaxID=30076 RepID=A0A161M618_TRIIF